MVLSKHIYWSTVIILLFCSKTAISTDAGARAVGEDVLIVRPLGVIDGFMTETISWKVLKLALEKSGRTYDLAASGTVRLMRREDDQMQALGEEGNLIWASPIFEPDTKLLPVKIPVLRDLSFYRYIWVPTEDISKFSHIRTADDLKEYSILTGQNWGANYILENEGFTLRTGAPENLPKMLMARRADVLLWPIMGTFRMIEKYGVKDLEMTPLPHVVVRLPQVVYFWVAPEGTQELRAALTSGLNTAIADGSLDELIRNFPIVGDAYSNLATKDLVVIDIENPDLSAGVQHELKTNGVRVSEQ